MSLVSIVLLRLFGTRVVSAMVSLPYPHNHG